MYLHFLGIWLVTTESYLNLGQMFKQLLQKTPDGLSSIVITKANSVCYSTSTIVLNVTVFSIRHQSVESISRLNERFYGNYSLILTNGGGQHQFQCTQGHLGAFHTVVFPIDRLIDPMVLLFMLNNVLNEYRASMVLYFLGQSGNHYEDFSPSPCYPIDSMLLRK